MRSCAHCFLWISVLWIAAVQGFVPKKPRQQHQRIFQLPRTTPLGYTKEGVKPEILSTLETERVTTNNPKGEKPRIVLVAGFESFNRDLYEKAAKELDVDLTVFADKDIRLEGGVTDDSVNPEFAQAVKNADAFIGSLIFDYDDVLAVKNLLDEIKGPRLIFESATELMSFNKVGSFSMEPKGDGPAGPPPAVKAVLSKFSSGKEEDKINGYLKLLKIGPTLLKYVPGEKASDLRRWLEAYRFWNQGGKGNFKSMLQLISHMSKTEGSNSPIELPELQVTPDIGLIHPLMNTGYFESPASYLQWRLSKAAESAAQKEIFTLAPSDAPKVAMLLYRKHVITEQRYILDLITQMEKEGIIPIPIFINGVEAHTIVRDLLTSKYEIDGVLQGKISRDTTYQSRNAVSIDAIVNTVGFPLVGGPAGSIEAGRNVEVSAKLLQDMNVPYIVASPLLLQTIQQWKTNGVLGLQSVVLYSLPELDGAIDTVVLGTYVHLDRKKCQCYVEQSVERHKYQITHSHYFPFDIAVLGGLVGDKIALVPERVRKLTGRLKGWVNLKRTPAKDRKIAISLYGFPPNVGAVGTAALLDVPKSLENLLKRLNDEGYDVGDFAKDPEASGESLVAALSILCENPVISSGTSRMQDFIESKIKRAQEGDKTVAATLAKSGGGLGGAKIRSKDVSMDELEKVIGKYMMKKILRSWPENERGPGVSSKGDLVVSGIQLGNVWITVQPLLGVEGDPMRLLFERDLTPHPQYCAAYEWMRLEESKGGIGAQAVIHFGMHGTFVIVRVCLNFFWLHTMDYSTQRLDFFFFSTMYTTYAGTVEWLPGQPLGNDRKSWSDELLGDLPNIYAYAANNPSESILAKRRG